MPEKWGSLGVCGLCLVCGLPFPGPGGTPGLRDSRTPGLQHPPSPTLTARASQLPGSSLPMVPQGPAHPTASVSVPRPRVTSSPEDTRGCLSHSTGPLKGPHTNGFPALPEEPGLRNHYPTSATKGRASLAPGASVTGSQLLGSPHTLQKPAKHGQRSQRRATSQCWPPSLPVLAHNPHTARTQTGDSPPPGRAPQGEATPATPGATQGRRLSHPHGASGSSRPGRGMRMSEGGVR